MGFSEHWELPSEDFQNDPRGHFSISTEPQKGQIIADHYGADGVLTNRITGTNARYIYKKIASLGLVSDLSHAAYIGSELRAAQISLERGLAYQQEKQQTEPAKNEPVPVEHGITYLKAGKMVSLPDGGHDENIRVGGVEVSFREFLKSRGLSRAF